MRNIIFVAPYFGEATVRFIKALVGVEDARVGLISQAPQTQLPPGIQARLAGHYQVTDGTSAAQIEAAARKLARHLGGLDRLVATLEHIQEQVAAARVALGLEGLDVETTSNFRDKARMKDRLRAAGIPCARHRRITSEADALGFASDNGYPIIIKPPALAGAVGTYRVDDARGLRAVLEQMPPSPAQPLVAEEFIKGQECSFETVLIDGEPVWRSGIYYRPRCLEVLENPWIQWTTLLPREGIEDPHFAGFCDTNLAALRALGLRDGISHMEWFQRPDGSTLVSEVAARPPGAQILPALEYAHDADFFDLWAGFVAHGRFAPPPRKYAVGVAFLRAQGRDGAIREVHGVEQVKAELGDLIVHARLPRPGQQRSASYEGDGLIFVRHERTEVAREAVDRVVQSIRVR